MLELHPSKLVFNWTVQVLIKLNIHISVCRIKASVWNDRVNPNGDGLAGRGQVRWSKAHAVYHMAL